MGSGRERGAAVGEANGVELDAARGEVTEHALETYLPRAKERRQGIALCLSGGGYRAALFHLGALRRLNELGVLSQLDTVSSVSGGSLVSAHLAARLRPWPQRGEVVAGWEERVAQPFHAFTRRNIRAGPLFKRLLPWNWPRSQTAVEALRDTYQRHLIALKFPELPDQPRFIFSATDMTFGVNLEISKARLGDYQIGYLQPAPDWPVARAVAASSCFPPYFDPLPLGTAPERLRGGRFPAGPKRDELISDLTLTDGGVYDNMGLEPVWKRARVVLVSDGGGTFDFESDRNWLMRLLRYNTIIGNQARAIRKRWLIASFIERVMEGTYWGTSSAVESYSGTAGVGYSKELAASVISEVRTDLDAFSDGEIAVLENHGYLLADAAIQVHAPQLLPDPVPPLEIPYPEWMDEARVRAALRHSHQLKLPFGRR